MSNPYQVQGQVPYIQMQQNPGFGFPPQTAPLILPPPNLINQPPYMYNQPEQMPQYNNDIHPDEVLKNKLEEKWKNKKKGKNRDEKNSLVQKEMREHLEKCNHKDCRYVFPE